MSVPDWLDAFPVPAPPEYALDWTSIEAAAPWLAELGDCMQEPEFHGEGDVLTHTRMVAGELVAMPGWRALGARARAEVFVAALLHDVSKPECVVVEDGRIRTPDHAARGARRARYELWTRGVAPSSRERIAWLVRLHHVPYHAFERSDPERSVIGASVVAGCRELALVSGADARGRISASRERLMGEVERFAALAEEHGCLDAAYPFADDHSRFMYWRRSDGAAAARSGRRRSVVTVMSGLPGAGKDAWLAANATSLPVVSTGQRARGHLERGDDFAWCATNLTEQVRRDAIGLLAQHGARVEIVSVEASPETLAERIRGRDQPLSDADLERLARGWDAPSLFEAHVLRTVLSG